MLYIPLTSSYLKGFVLIKYKIIFSIANVTKELSTLKINIFILKQNCSSVTKVSYNKAMKHIDRFY